MLLSITEFAGPIAAVLLAFILGVIFGERWTRRWNIRQLRKERELQSANELYRLYGEWFTLWRMWAQHKAAVDDASSGAEGMPDDAKRRFLIYDRACSAEGAVESLIVSVAAEKTLRAEDLAVLGRFRQAYQVLRGAIRKDQRLAIFTSQDPRYLAFKWLAVRVARILISPVHLWVEPPDVVCGGAALETITSNIWEEGGGGWSKTAQIGRNEDLARKARDEACRAEVRCEPLSQRERRRLAQSPFKCDSSWK